MQYIQFSLSKIVSNTFAVHKQDVHYEGTLLSNHCSEEYVIFNGNSDLIRLLIAKPQKSPNKKPKKQKGAT